MSQPIQQYGSPQSMGHQQPAGQRSQATLGQQGAQGAGVGPVGTGQQFQTEAFQPQQGGGPYGQPGTHQPTAGPGFKLEEAISDEMRVSLHDFVESATVSAWCAEQCIEEGPQMAECIRLCRDVADLATLNVQLLSRDSVFGPEVAEVFAQAAEACARECARHSQKHCQECAEVLGRAARSTRKMLASFDNPQTQQFVPQGGQTP